MVINNLRGTFKVAAVKAPGYGDRRKAMLQDIAVMVGGTAIFEDLGIKLENLQLSDLGTAKKVVIDKDNTTIVEGGGSTADLKARIEQIRRELENSTSDYDREKLEERVAKLAGGVAQVNVGAATESEMKEKKARVEDALHATRAAVEEGILPGGGVALLRASGNVKAAKKQGHDFATGYSIILRACRAPLTQIANNAGKDGSVVCEKVLSADGNQGYNAASDEYEDLVSAGIIDPAKVTRTALQNAASVSTLLLDQRGPDRREARQGQGRRRDGVGRPVLISRRSAARVAAPGGNAGGCFRCASGGRVQTHVPLNVADRIGPAIDPHPAVQD